MTPKDTCRAFSIERAKVNAETGEFRAVVFTDGEASDGHILSIEGASVPDQIPLFVNHSADPRTQLGSLYPLERTAHQIVMRGEIFLGGDGPELEIRRDILAKMAAGHVSQMSGRWDYSDEDVIRRTELPEDHPAFVSQKKAKKDWRYRYGYFFRKWRAMEGSVVGLGADPAAVMRWAEDASASAVVQSFWRAQAEIEREREAETLVTRRDLERFTDDLAGIIHEAIEQRIAAAARVDLEDNNDAGDEPEDARAEQAPAGAGAERSEEPADDAPARENLPNGRDKWDPGEVAAAIAQTAERRNAAFLAEMNALVSRAQGKV